MIKKKLYLLLSIGLLLSSVTAAFAVPFTSIAVSTLSAGVSFSSIPNPRITHTGVTQLTQISTDTFAVIDATAATADWSMTGPNFNDPLTSVYINYYLDTQTSFSTVTVSVSANTVQKFFESKIQVSQTASQQTFYYRITAVDYMGSAGRWPPAGNFYSFSIASLIPAGPPQLSHNPISYVSAIDGLVVATGTATGQAGLASVGMCYRTDADVNFSTYTITLSSNPSVYNFRFQLDKNSVNFAKAKFFYYYLRAADLNSKIAYLPALGSFYTASVIAAQTITLGANGGNITLPNGNPADGSTTLVIPQGALDGTTAVTITEMDPSDNSIPPGKSPCASVKPVAVYSFGPEKLNFKKFVTMKLLFSDVDHDKVVDGTSFKASSLKIFWWDGFDWRLLGGKLDKDLNLVSYEKIQHFSMYAAFPVTSMNDNDYRPKERIITPATVDNKNDFALFSGLVDGDVVNIYDVIGRKIRQLNNESTWDGKDDSGRLVESGIYIYQIKLNDSGKIISGTIVVAK